MGCERGVSASTLLDFFNQLQVNMFRFHFQNLFCFCSFAQMQISEMQAFKSTKSFDFQNWLTNAGPRIWWGDKHSRGGDQRRTCLRRRGFESNIFLDNYTWRSPTNFWKACVRQRGPKSYILDNQSLILAKKTLTKKIISIRLWLYIKIKTRCVLWSEIGRRKTITT